MPPQEFANPTLARAYQYQMAGQLDEAAALYAQRLKTNPDCSETHQLLGLLHYQRGDLERGIKHLHQAVQTDPQNGLYRFNFGNLLSESGQEALAAQQYQECIRIKPEWPEPYINLGVLFTAAGQYEQAEETYARALQLRPNDPVVLTNQVNLRIKQNQWSLALTEAQHLLTHHPRHHTTHIQLGFIELGLGNPHGSAHHFRTALGFLPQRPDAWMGLAESLADAPNQQETIHAITQALEQVPEEAGLWHNLSVAWMQQGEFHQAAKSSRKALALLPNFLSALEQSWFVHRATGEWQEAGNAAKRLDALRRQGETYSPSPFYSVARQENPAENRRAAQLHITHQNRITAPATPFSFSEIQPKSRLRIGYLSNDFHDHATAHLIAGLLQAHDRRRIECVAYSYGPDTGDSYQRRIRNSVDHWVQLREDSHPQAAQKIYDDKVDILVDLKGHTRGNRMEICTLKPAPVLVNYLGYPGTTGMDCYDYIIADPVVLPKEAWSHYTESVVWMPHAYQATDRTQLQLAPTPSRAQLGLPEESLVLCSFNQTWKLEPHVFSLWMQALKQHPDTVLWLWQEDIKIQKTLRAAAQHAEVDPKRLFFAGRVGRTEHLARLTQANLALDTGTYNGHTTTSDALCAGIPVITRQGAHFASRVSASLLHSVGRTGLITDSWPAYAALLDRLLTHRAQLDAHRAILKKTRWTAPLFQTEFFTRAMEEAFHRMWAQRVHHSAPTAFQVGASPP